jgi:hypothetical protein
LHPIPPFDQSHNANPLRYGFKNVVTTCDILAAEPRLWDFLPRATDKDVTECARPLPKPINPTDPANSLKIDAIFSINDARWWHWDSQVLMDILISREGVLGTISPKNGDANLPNNGWGMDDQPRVYFSADDLEYSNGWAVPRFGCGAFNRAFFGVWAEKTNSSELNYMTIGKPTHFQYDFIEKKEGAIASKLNDGKHCPLIRNYMIGDNPLSDIAGAMNYRSVVGTEWRSVLVETGVYKAGTVPPVEPTVIKRDCFDGVLWAMTEEGLLEEFLDTLRKIRDP